MSAMTSNPTSSTQTDTPGEPPESCKTIPLPSGHWYGVKDSTGLSHYGATSTERATIAKIQKVLNTACGAVPKVGDIATDGIYGAKTRALCIEFQQRLNTDAQDSDDPRRVAVDGQFGRQTWDLAYRYGWYVL